MNVVKIKVMKLKTMIVIIEHKNKTNVDLDIIDKSNFNNESYMGRHSNKLFS